MMSYTIYFIENVVNHKGYVGMTCKPAEQRFKEHLQAARRGIDYALHRAIRKYGEENFHIFPIDEASSEEQAFELEQEWIERLGTYEFEYNATPGGRGITLSGEEAHAASVSDDKAYEILERYLMTDREVFSMADAAEEIDCQTVAVCRWVNGECRPYLLERFYEKHPDYDGWTPLDGRLLAALTEFLTTKTSKKEAADKYEVTPGQIEGCQREDCRPHILERFHEENPDWDGEVPRRNGCGLGENSSNSKFTEDEVIEIRRRYVEDKSLSKKELADEFDAGKSTIGAIVRGETWTHVGGPTMVYKRGSTGHSKGGAQGERNTNSKLTAADVKDIRNRYADSNIQQKQLAEEYDITRSAMSSLLRGQTWTHVGGPIKS
jgi:predicted XRE-type DNA-binding protein